MGCSPVRRSRRSPPPRPERCWYVASLSKIVTPALRPAYVRTPSVATALRPRRRCARDGDHGAATQRRDGEPLDRGRNTLAPRCGDADRDRLAAGSGRRHPRCGRAQAVAGGLSSLVAPSRPIIGATSRPARCGSMDPRWSRPAASRWSGTSTQAVRVSLGGLVDRERLGLRLRVLHGHGRNRSAGSTAGLKAGSAQGRGTLFGELLDLLKRDVGPAYQRFELLGRLSQAPCRPGLRPGSARFPESPPAHRR